MFCWFLWGHVMPHWCWSAPAYSGFGVFLLLQPEPHIFFFSTADRCKEVQQIREQHPNKIPVSSVQVPTLHTHCRSRGELAKVQVHIWSTAGRTACLLCCCLTSCLLSSLPVCDLTSCLRSSLSAIRGRSSCRFWTRPSSWFRITWTWASWWRSSGTHTPEAAPPPPGGRSLADGTVRWAEPGWRCSQVGGAWLTALSCSSSSCQAPPAAEPHPGLLPIGQPAQHGVRGHAHLPDLRAGARRGWLPLHGLRLPGDLRLLRRRRRRRCWEHWEEASEPTPPLCRQIHHCGNKPRPFSLCWSVDTLGAH